MYLGLKNAAGAQGRRGGESILIAREVAGERPIAVHQITAQRR